MKNFNKEETLIRVSLKWLGFSVVSLNYVTEPNFCWWLDGTFDPFIKEL